MKCDECKKESEILYGMWDHLCGECNADKDERRRQDKGQPKLT